MQYVIGVDVGGTFTDAVVRDETGSLTLGKAFSTPPDFDRGIVDSVGVAAEKLGLSVSALLSQTALLIHSCTVTENAVFDKTGVKAGLLVTRGFEEVLVIMRGGYGRWFGLTEEELKHPVKTDKPVPLIPVTMTRGIRERTDYKGEVLVHADAGEIRQAVKELVDAGAEAIAVCFLWSFKNDANEKIARKVLEEECPQLFRAISSEVAPSLGEYERASTVALSAYLGPLLSSYLRRLQQTVVDSGFRGSLLVMQAYGGLVPPAEAVTSVVGTIESGPASGLKASEFALGLLGEKNIIATDLGGTTFKAGVMREGVFDYAREPSVARYHYTLAKLDVVSIGAGGGSIVSVDPRLNLPKVGPNSAGAYPGPVCYDHGGNEPTLVDVDLILGYLDPRFFLGGRSTLNREKALAVFEEKVADRLGMDPLKAAAGIYTLANSIMFDLLHKITVERGLDPRRCALAAYGGQAGLHAGAYGPKLGVSEVVVPYAASVFSAFGLVLSDVVHQYFVAEHLRMLVPPATVNGIFTSMERKAVDQLVAEGFPRESIVLERALDMRFGRQVHVMAAPVKAGSLSDADVAAVCDQFEALYEQRYGKGSGHRQAGIEVMGFRLRATAVIPKPRLHEFEVLGNDARDAIVGSKEIYLDGQGLVEAQLYDFERLHSGNEVRGPAIVLTPITTILVFPGQLATCDRFKNVVITY
ncbi:MAG: hydantoinase/oxoprolinase family protein [Chloroflexi bacterium]|nr:hydantoinase/oxoprolinase family protein [Chloroflexota bacterium]